MTLGEDSQGGLQDFGRGLWGFMRLWERIHEDFKTLGEDL